MDDAPVQPGDEARRSRLAILAQSDGAELARLWAALGLDPRCTPIRGPETGLVMLRGRTGGTGQPFNFGEATVTRATVKLANGAIGHAMALGRDKAKVRIGAVIDALCQDDKTAARIDRKVIDPLRAQHERRDRERAAQTAATKVDFFTMVRGED